MRKLSALAAIGILWASAAPAADLYYYDPPAKGDVIYTPHSMVTGDVSFAGGFVTNQQHSLFGTGGGQATFDVHNGWNFMGEVAAASTSILMGYGHLYKRLPGAAVGVFGGIGVMGGGVVDFGVEGQKEISPEFIIGGNAGYVAGIANNSGGGYGHFGLNATYYFSPYTKLRGDLDWTGVSGGSWGASALLAHQFNGGPIVGHGQIGVTNTAGNSSFFALGGLTVMFNQPGTTLRQHDERSPWRMRYRFAYP